MASITDRLTTEQREALWKWRWLGWRDSTPAFKASMALLGIVGVVLGLFLFRM